MRQTIPNLTERNRRSGEPVYIWQPGPTRRKAGWKAVALKLDDGTHSPERVAVLQARWLNAILAAWAKQDNERIEKLQMAWRSGRDERDDGKTISACPFIEPPFPGGLKFTVAHVARHVTAADLWAHYEKSKEFRDTSDGTKRTYRNQFKPIVDWLASDPAAKLTKRSAETYFELISSPSVSAIRLAVARVVFAVAVDDGLVQSNPFVGVSVAEPPPRVRIWTPDEIAASIEVTTKAGREDLARAIKLGLSTAQRPIDFCRIGISHRLDGRGWRGWRIKQMKTGKIVEPINDTQFAPSAFVDELDELHHENLKRLPDLADDLRTLRSKVKTWKAYDTLPYIIRENGLPHSVDSLAHDWKKYRPEVAKLVPSILHGTEASPLQANIQDLRDTAVTSMAERGWSILQICAQSGHEPKSALEVLKHYVAMTGDLASSHVRQMTMLETPTNDDPKSV